MPFLPLRSYVLPPTLNSASLLFSSHCFCSASQTNTFAPCVLLPLPSFSKLSSHYRFLCITAQVSYKRKSIVYLLQSCLRDERLPCELSRQEKQVAGTRPAAVATKGEYRGFFNQIITAVDNEMTRMSYGENMKCYLYCHYNIHEKNSSRCLKGDVSIMFTHTKSEI